jgi:hypothetical protein
MAKSDLSTIRWMAASDDGSCAFVDAMNRGQDSPRPARNGVDERSFPRLLYLSALTFHLLNQLSVLRKTGIFPSPHPHVHR